ncbi:RcpC/CpaB family pilus assembly protein [Streptomyces sp. NPDC006660]|uniref:RcpC/CpaB family pilus assembly protein n=1 Tax=Streptomyces sp. NPDC006660 TaxID=3156901 RepID=UPI0033C2105D
MPFFPPLRVRGGKNALRRAMRKRRRALAAGLAVTAAALAVSSPQAAERPRPATATAPAPRERGPARPAPAAPAELVSAPVRIADAETVRLLRPGDRVDVIASANSPSGAADEARVVATNARVKGVPASRQAAPDTGALVILAVPRETARALAGAGTTSRLAVTLC